MSQSAIKSVIYFFIFLFFIFCDVTAAQTILGLLSVTSLSAKNRPLWNCCDVMTVRPYCLSSTSEVANRAILKTLKKNLPPDPPPPPSIPTRHNGILRCSTADCRCVIRLILCVHVLLLFPALLNAGVKLFLDSILNGSEVLTEHAQQKGFKVQMLVSKVRVLALSLFSASPPGLLSALRCINNVDRIFAVRKIGRRSSCR